MSHYEERLEGDLEQIRAHVATVGAKVEEAITNAARALLTANDELAAKTILSDMSINRLVRESDRLCHRFIAIHLPSAGHLRLISSVIRTNIELERIGDYAVSICRESVQLSKPPQRTLANQVELMANEARHMLGQSIKAFNEGNADVAKATMPMASQIDRTFDAVFAELTRQGSEWSIEDLMGLFVVCHRLERVAAQAKNICEETVFAVTGETKAPKTYRILFLDEDNSCLAPMAQAIARKTFPNSGEYSSAGRQAASVFQPRVAEFLEGHGFELGSAAPKALDLAPQELASYHVIVSLQGTVRSYITNIPFHTVALEWDVGSTPKGLDDERCQRRLEELYREIGVHVRELMEALRGKDAS